MAALLGKLKLIPGVLVVHQVHSLLAGGTKLHALEVDVGPIEEDGWVRRVSDRKEGLRESRSGEDPQLLHHFAGCRGRGSELEYHLSGDR